LRKKVDALYEDALALYRRGVYDKSFEMLQAVEDIWPDYRLTPQYMRLIQRETNGAVGSGSDQETGVQEETADQDSPMVKEILVEHYLDAFEGRDITAR